jgi:hypothetical protein
MLSYLLIYMKFMEKGIEFKNIKQIMQTKKL